MTPPIGISGATRVAGIIGDPVAHSRSPAIYNAAFAATGVDWVFVAFPVPAGHGRDAVRAARELGLAGLTVTMPHKGEAAWACDELSADATALGAANVVVRLDDGRLRGDCTDGEGFVRSVRELGFDPAGRRALVLGAGGAARAIAWSLARAGAEVTIAARRRDAAESVAGLLTGARAVLLSDADPGAADLVVNATPVGMGGEAPVIDPDRLNRGQLVVDTIYHPMETPLLAAARARGIPHANGLGMLVHQAAVNFELLTGHGAPLEAMRAAAELATPA